MDLTQGAEELKSRVANKSLQKTTEVREVLVGILSKMVTQEDLYCDQLSAIDPSVTERVLRDRLKMATDPECGGAARPAAAVFKKVHVISDSCLCLGGKSQGSPEETMVRRQKDALGWEENRGSVASQILCTTSIPMPSLVGFLEL